MKPPRGDFIVPLCALLAVGALLAAPAHAATAGGMELSGEKSFRYEGRFADDLTGLPRGFTTDQELRFLLRGEPAPGITTRIDYDDRERERFRALRLDARGDRYAAAAGDLDGPVTPFRMLPGDPTGLRGLRLDLRDESGGDAPHRLFVAASTGDARTERFFADGREGAYFLPDRDILPGARVFVSGREVAANEVYALDLENGLLSFVDEPPPGAECRVEYRVASPARGANNLTVGVTTGVARGESVFGLLVVGTPGAERPPLLGVSQSAALPRGATGRVELLTAAPDGDAPPAAAFGYELALPLPGGRSAELTGKAGGFLPTPGPLPLPDDYRRLELPGPTLAGFATSATLHESAAGRSADLSLAGRDGATRLGLRREDPHEATDSGGTTRADLRVDRTVGRFRTETRVAQSVPDRAAAAAAQGTVDLAAQGTVGDLLTRVEAGRRDAAGAETWNGRLRTRKRLSDRTALSAEWSGRRDDAGAASLAETRAGASLERTLSERLRATADLSSTGFRDLAADRTTRSFADLSLGLKFRPLPRVELIHGLLARRGDDAALARPIRRDEARLSLRAEAAPGVEVAAGGNLARSPFEDGGRRRDGEVAWRFRRDAKLRLYARDETSGALSRESRGVDVTALFGESFEGTLDLREEGTRSPLLRDEVVDRRGAFRLTARM